MMLNQRKKASGIPEAYKLHNIQDYLLSYSCQQSFGALCEYGNYCAAEYKLEQPGGERVLSPVQRRGGIES